MASVLDFDPMWRPAAPIRSIPRFETNPSRPMLQTARKRSGPISPCPNGATKMPSGHRARSRARLVLRRLNGRSRQVVTIECQDVEGIELHLAIVLVRMQGIEIRNAIDTKNDRLAIDDELLHAVLERRLDDPWTALRPIGPVAGDQAHAIAVALDPQPIAIVLDFVQPVRGMPPYRAVLIEKGLRAESPENGNIAQLGWRLSAISREGCHFSGRGDATQNARAGI